MTTDQKKEIRQEVKYRRAEAALETLHESSQKIKDTFAELEAYQNAALLLAYVDAKREVETRLLMAQAWKDGKKVAAPRVDGDGIMHYYYIEEMDIVLAGAIALLVVLAFMLTVIVTLIVLSRRVRNIGREIYRIERQVGDYIDELSQSEGEKMELEQQAHQDVIISSVLQEMFP